MFIRNLTLALVVFAGSMTPGLRTQAQPYGGDAIECTSRSYAYQRCEVPWADARIVRQLSDTQCVRGRNWGFERRGGFIWVDRGCSARFLPAGDYGAGPGYGGGPGPGGGGWRPGPDWNQRFMVTCESQGHDNNFCQVDVGGAGRVYLERQLSSAPCIEGRSWGWNRAGVWVGQGCRATFSVDRRWR